jgi:hypothetical protein
VEVHPISLFYSKLKTKIMKKYLFCLWLGLSLTIAGFKLSDWQYWLIIIPTIFFVVFFNEENEEK